MEPRKLNYPPHPGTLHPLVPSIPWSPPFPGILHTLLPSIPWGPPFPGTLHSLAPSMPLYPRSLGTLHPMVPSIAWHPPFPGTLHPLCLLVPFNHSSQSVSSLLEGRRGEQESVMSWAPRERACKMKECQELQMLQRRQVRQRLKLSLQLSDKEV